MNRRSLRHIAGLVLVSVAVSAFSVEGAQAASNAGTNAATFLRIGHGARSAGMGGAFTAISEGALAAYWNPAGLASLESSEISLGHFAWFQDISVEQLTFATPAFGNVVTAVSLTYVNYGTIDGYDAAGISTGDLAAHDLAASLSLGFELTDDLCFGATGKYISQRLDTYSASAFAADLGVKYDLDRLTLAATLTNVGTSLKFDEVEESLPQSLRMGLAYRPFGHRILTSIEWEKESSGEIFVRQGMELSFSERYFLRTGYDYVVGVQNQSLTSGLSAGAGLKLSGASFDYAYTPDFRSVSDGLHRFTIVFNFGQNLSAKSK